VENSMHSSRAAFSSLHTQQGLGFAAAALSAPEGLFEAARLLIWRESEAGDGVRFGLDFLVLVRLGDWDGNWVGAYCLLRGKTL
jgi:hypothetical protein